MCGIVGIVAPGRSSDELRRVVTQMTSCLVHRGPDDDGFFIGDGVGLGMRRLSIIDVAGGRQPLTNEDGRVHVVFNGEIYNYRELQRELCCAGHFLRTSSDTEVIAHLYEDSGVNCLEKLRGMFGIAIWDQTKRRLLLARDRVGKKPLYYVQDGDTLLFASEMKAILAVRPDLGVLNNDALVPYFRFGFIPEPRTIYDRVFAVPAAHWLSWEDSSIRIVPYWQLTIGCDRKRYADGELVEELDSLLEDSVRIRLISDVPLGVFLSGGLDSSTVVAYAHKAGLRPIRTYTVGFDRPSWDESDDAERVARHFGTEHHCLRLCERDLSDKLPETVHALIRHFDQPFGDPSALPTYHIARLARENVTVLLSGDGGDELFFGYSCYRGHRLAEMYKHVPNHLRSVIPSTFRALARMMPSGHRYTALWLAKVWSDSALPFVPRYFSKSAMCSDAVLEQLFTPALWRAIQGSPAQDCSDECQQVLRSDWPVLVRLNYMDFRHHLLNQMLVKVDRMSMAHSLEVRSPFLDHRLLEFVAGLPSSVKLRGWETKAILRDTVRPYLPAATLRKKKQGFSIPLRDWLRSGLHEMVLDYLAPAGNRLPVELFDHKKIAMLIREHFRGDADHSSAIWLLLNYATWKELQNVRTRPEQHVLAV